ncbi:MAG TPA: hypothetical protein VMH83_15885 [Candidatus Acidoferrum sp.]|nr:hypothetical protein [Candidatus Acidoferrum sp.]
MSDLGVGLKELGFWLGLAIVIVAFIWAGEKKKQRDHELKLKLLEKGDGLDKDLLEKLLTSDKPGTFSTPKSAIERRRQEKGIGVFLFLVSGLLFGFMGIAMHGNKMQPVEGAAGRGGIPLMTMVDTGPNWVLVGLGMFCFVFGCLFWLYAEWDYKRAKAEAKAAEKQSQG